MSVASLSPEYFDLTCRAVAILAKCRILYCPSRYVRLGQRAGSLPSRRSALHRPLLFAAGFRYKHAACRTWALERPPSGTTDGTCQAHTLALPWPRSKVALQRFDWRIKDNVRTSARTHVHVPSKRVQITYCQRAWRYSVTFTYQEERTLVRRSTSSSRRDAAFHWIMDDQTRPRQHVGSLTQRHLRGSRELRGFFEGHTVCQAK